MPIVERIIGVIALAIALVLLFRQSDPFMITAFFGIAAAQLLRNPIKKVKWLRGLEKGKRFDESVEIQFDESGIKTNGPFSSAEMSREGIERQRRTPKGLLLWPQKGAFFYLPESQVDNSIIDYVQSKVARQFAAASELVR